MAGRPKITLSDLPDKWQESAMELGRVGASDVEIRVEALGGICHETWTRLLEEDPIFSETIKKARDLCQLWWERHGRTALRDDKFSATLWYMNMKNRFGWADKQDINQNNTGAPQVIVTKNYLPKSE